MSARNDKDYKSFTDIGSGDWARNVIMKGGLGLAPFDRVDITYPTSTTEVYTFSLSAATTDIITLTYSDSSKNTLTTVVKT